MKRSRVQSGFTLVEALITIVVAGIVAGLGLTYFLTATRSNNAIHGNQTLMDNLGSSLETIVRIARAGTNFGVSGAQTFTVEDDTSSGVCHYKFFLYNDTTATPSRGIIRRQDIDNCIGGQTVDSTLPGITVDLTLPAINVNSLSFTLNNGGNPYASVLINLKAKINQGTKDEQTINLQTTIAQRS